MRNNRSVLFISAIALILLALVPAVSANEVIYDRDLYEYIDTSKSDELTWEDSPATGGETKSILFKDITKAQTLNYLVFELKGGQGTWLNGTKIKEGRYDFTYHFNGADRPGVLYLNRKTNILGQVTSTQFTIFLNDWDIGNLRDRQIINMPFIFVSGGIVTDEARVTTDTNTYPYPLPVPRWTGVSNIKVTESTGIEWKHHIKVSEDFSSYYVDINGFIDGHKYTSQVNLWKDGEIYATFTNPGNKFSRAYLKTEINLLEIISPQGTEYAYPLYADDTPVEPTPTPTEDSGITVYIKNSQTGALIADARIVLDALVDGEYYTVTNRTEPSGIFTITLQPTGGGKPNPDRYRLIVTADGYNNPMPEIDFTLGDYRKYIECFLDPIAGGPADENKTFIDFFVRDMSSNPISGATVKFGKYTLITNSAGYTVFEVDKNNNYSWIVSKSGYGTLAGNAVIGNDPRHTINTVLAPTPSEDSTLTVYIKNSQTGALIANANVAIDALVDGEYYPVTNRTEPSGIFTITLQPTGGGKPNPDSYRLIVTADGYNNPMPEINFTVDDYKNYIHCLLDPIAGGPADENKTFIDFFVRDMTSNPISGATVKFGKYTLITNSAGYTVFEVDKNNNYSWTVSKSGYGALTGNAVIGNDPRHTINTVLAPIVTPTTTTPIPTSPPIGPTPTMTAPTGEPVSNWLEWFAAHFGMILGGGVEIGKIFMWLCFTVPVGVYVGKEAKAGAAGFMAGAGIVTLFFVVIGWVPIWLVVLLALIIGLLYAKAFNAQDNGGGR